MRSVRLPLPPIEGSPHLVSTLLRWRLPHRQDVIACDIINPDSMALSVSAASTGRGSRAEKVRRIFERFDTNGDGGLDRNEMAALVVTVNPRVKFSEDQISAILDEVFRTYAEIILPDGCAHGGCAGKEVGAAARGRRLGRLRGGGGGGCGSGSGIGRWGWTQSDGWDTGGGTVMPCLHYRLKD
jgi:hypothetical protein